MNLPIGRWYYRCRDCLSIVAADAQVKTPACTCGGTYKTLGQVSRALCYETVTHESPCDGRCTEARGPNCNCQCGGKNHGSERVVPVIHDHGNVPTITPIDLPAALARATAFHAAQSAAITRIERVGRAEWEAKVRGEWLDGPGFDRYLAYARARLAIESASTRKTQAGRLRALAMIGASAPVETA